MERLAIYYRVSTDKQDLSSQKHAIEEWILTRKTRAIVTLELEDEGYSGKDSNRPSLKKLIRAAREKKIDTVVVYNLDRLSRDATTAIRLVLDFDDNDVAFVSVTQPVLNLGHDAPFRRTMLAAFAELGQLEREMIVARVKAGIEAARKRGVRLGAPRKLTDDQIAVAKVMRAEGKPYRHIAAFLGVSLGTIANLFSSKEKAAG